MKFRLVFLLPFLLVNCVQNNAQEKPLTKDDRYEIIGQTDQSEPGKDSANTEALQTANPGRIDIPEIQKLNIPLKAMAAFYAAMGGTMCVAKYCDLTTALGLGEQGSEKHQNLIREFFPNDKVAAAVLKQDCYLRPGGASTFSDFEFLTLIDKGDTVMVDYSLMHYNRGDVTWTKGPDIYIFSDNTFKKLKRNLWAFVEAE